MSAHDEDRIQHLLRQALPPVQAQPEPGHSLEPNASLEHSPEPAIDLWPQVLRRLDNHPAAQSQSRWVWFDWALAAGLAVLVVVSPASIPLLLYYL
jgi:hypothetical protein